MPKSILFDTSVYIRSLRQNSLGLIAKRHDGNSSVWLSAIVLEEMYVGASTKETIKILTKLEHDFTKINRLLVPNQADWVNTGKILNRIGLKDGFEKVGNARLTNDALLASAAARNGLKLITLNEKEFFA